MDAGDIRPPGSDDLRYDQVENDGRNTDQREDHTVFEHENKIDNHHDNVQKERSQHIHQGGCNRGVCILPLQKISGKALGEKVHRKPQELPHVITVSDGCHFAVDLERIDGLDPGRRDLGDSKNEHQSQKRVKQVYIFTGQQPVHEETDKGGIDDSEKISGQC